MKKILENLLNQGLLVKEKGIGIDQISKRMKRAAVDLKNAKLLLRSDEVGAYRMAYDSMLQAGMALVLYFGYRPKVNGFHKTIVESTSLILGDECSIVVKKFDQMRRNRHQAIYDAGIVSLAETESAISTAEKFIKSIARFIKEVNPQKELFD